MKIEFKKLRQAMLTNVAWCDARRRASLLYFKGMIQSGLSPVPASAVWGERSHLPAAAGRLSGECFVA